MNKLNVFVVLFISVILFACKKDIDAGAGKKATGNNETKIDTASLPHYGEKNTPAITWDQLPSELKNAASLKSEAPGKSARTSEATYSWYSYATGAYGGGGGSPFFIAPPAGSRIYAMALYTGALVDRIVVWYQTASGYIYCGGDKGGWGGAFRLYYFAPDEYIYYVYGASGGLVDFLAFYTNRKVFYGGGWGGQAWSVSVPYGYQILGFYGASGAYIDRLGFYVYTL